MSLTKWFKDDWVDIGAPKKGGGYKKCGRSKTKGSKRSYPKCVPASKASSMSKKKNFFSCKTQKRKKTRCWR